MNGAQAAAHCGILHRPRGEAVILFSAIEPEY